MKRSKGFTLVELLAVIVILAIILAIAIPGISGLIDSVKKSTLSSNVKLLIKSLKTNYESISMTTGSFPNTFILIEDNIKTVYPNSNDLDFEVTDKEGGIVVYNDGSVMMALYDGTYCATKSRLSDDVEVITTTKEACISNVYYEQAAAPFTNIITNADFSNDLVDWDSDNSTVSVANGEAFVTALDNEYYASLIQETSILTDSNPKVYVYAEMKVYDVTVYIYILGEGNSNISSSEIDNPKINKWYSVSGVLAFSGQTGNMYYKPLIQYENISDAVGKRHSVRRPIAINLTALYGVGNEPTQEQMDNNINKVWIDSSTNTPKIFTSSGWVDL
jgi:type IV pilus assembly protein PilA